VDRFVKETVQNDGTKKNHSLDFKAMVALEMIGKAMMLAELLACFPRLIAEFAQRLEEQANAKEPFYRDANY